MSHGPKCNDDEDYIEIFGKKVVYSFLLRIEIQDKNVYSILGIFFNFEVIFRRSDHLWVGGKKSHPPKGRRERPVRSRARFKSSDLPGPAQSCEPGQAGPVWAGPGQAIGDGPELALARLRVAESQSQRLRPVALVM
jgi:hypothetical protein